MAPISLRPSVAPLSVARVLALGLALLVAGAVAASAAEEDAPGEAPTIFKWVDDNGIAHYTTEYETIPRNLRRDARRLLPRTAAGGDTGTDAPAARPSATGGSRVSEANRWSETDRPRSYDDGWGGDDGWDQGGEGGGDGSESEAIYENRAARRHDIDTRIAELENEIADDEDVLKRFVAAPAPQDTAEVAYDLTFREVAERLPRMLTELRGLQDERAQLDEN